MISFHCGSTMALAARLRDALQSRGYRVWWCAGDLAAGAPYRREIARNAALCRLMMPLVNENWAKSLECEYEYNIALRTALVTKTRPILVPVILNGSHSLFGDLLALAGTYPVLLGMAGNTNCVFTSLKPTGDDDGTGAIDKLVAAVADQLGEPVATPLSPPVANAAAGAAAAAAAALPSPLPLTPPATPSSGSHTDGQGQVAPAMSAVPFDAAKHVLNGEAQAGRWEGYFVDFRSSGGPDGKQAGLRWSWELTGVLSVIDGTFMGRGRDECSSGEVRGKVDSITGTVSFVKTCFTPREAVAADTLTSPLARGLVTWPIYYRGSIDARGHMRGRWAFEDKAYAKMRPDAYFALWPAAENGNDEPWTLPKM